MPDGILIIDKPADWTSMDVCAKLRGIFHEKRIGHGGTLDPMATGVLPVFIGRATRAVELAEQSDKEYIAALRLGIVTDTQDSTGHILEEHPVTVSRQELEAILPRFTGDIQQIPPMYSAIKIGGKKLYQLARKGKEIERPARSITIYALELLDAPHAAPNEYLLRARCSKGTYIRTLCHDIGQALGCGAVMSSLRRTMACGFTLENAVSLDAVAAHGNPASLLLPTDAYFADRPILALKGAAEKKVRNGAPIPAPEGLSAGEYRLYGADGTFLALSRCENGVLKSMKNFFGA